ncbi:MAG: oligosaccharide flippase family protein [Candidatus Pacearchaeota archaeon]|jgi:O-antigen/teichoic acid export membrane protein
MLKDKYHQHKETVDNFIWRVLQLGSKQGIIFIIFILCAKILVPYDFGIYNYVLAIIFFLVIFGDFGISTATSKYVTEYSLIDKEKLKAVLFNSGILILGLTLLITALTLIIGPSYLKDKYAYVLYLLPLIFLTPMTSLYDGIYRGLKKFKKLAIISVIASFISIIFVYFLVKQYGLIGALIAQNLFYLILLIGLAIGYKEFNFKWNKTVMKEVGKYSFVYGIAVVGNYLFMRFGILILGHYNYIDQIAVYELLNKIFMALVLPFSMLGQVIAPNFTILAAKKDYAKIYQKLKKYTLIFLAAGIILGLLAYFLGPILIRIFFANYYNNLFFEIFIFTVIIFVTNVWSATIDFGITVPTGYASLMAKFYLILGVLGVILSFILLHLFGYIGIIYAFTISSVLMAIGLRLIYFYKIRKKVSNS